MHLRTLPTIPVIALAGLALPARLAPEPSLDELADPLDGGLPS